MSLLVPKYSLKAPELLFKHRTDMLVPLVYKIPEQRHHLALQEHGRRPLYVLCPQSSQQL